MKNMILILKIFQPFNLLLSCISVAMVVFLFNYISSPICFYAMLVVFCFGAASNMLNDILDIKIDRVNKLKRAMPMGLLNVHFAMLLACVLYVIGIMLTYFLQPLGQNIALYVILPLLIFLNCSKRTTLQHLSAYSGQEELKGPHTNFTRESFVIFACISKLF